MDILKRSDRLPTGNKFAGVSAQGFNNGFYKLDDLMRWKFKSVGFSAGTPPTVDSLQRISRFSNFRLISNAAISDVNFDGSQIQVIMPNETFSYDFIILGTGYQVDGYQRQELSRIIDDVALWKDCIPIETVNQHPKMGEFPYLGSSYEFLPKNPNQALHLKNIYCFNYAAILSHGLLSTHILGISIGATRLAQGIAADFFIQDCNWYLEQMENFQESEFDQQFPLEVILP